MILQELALTPAPKGLARLHPVGGPPTSALSAVFKLLALAVSVYLVHYLAGAERIFPLVALALASVVGVSVVRRVLRHSWLLPAGTAADAVALSALLSALGDSSHPLVVVAAKRHWESLMRALGLSGLASPARAVSETLDDVLALARASRDFELLAGAPATRDTARARTEVLARLHTAAMR